MLLQVNGVGKQKMLYKNHNDVAFDSLNDYIILAKKAISKFSHVMSGRMLKDEDAISSVANAIMMADWRWDENYQSKKGTKKTKYSYRNQCAIWAIQTYLSKEYQKNKRFSKVYSLDYSTENENNILHDTVNDKKDATPDKIAIDNEYTQNTKKLVDMILVLDCISEKQKDYIRLYYLENKTFEQIGKKYGITREAVRQGLNKAVSIIRSHINEFSI